MTKNEHTNTYNGEEIYPSIDDDNQDFPPLVVSYNDKIRPILDAVDKLRRLNVTQEGIPLPTIVVVGDQSSGKSSVLESLAGISLPRGQDICTRVPLIMRLQHHTDPVPEFLLEYQKKSIKIDEESQISDAINKATVEIAGNSKGISNVPLTLVVKKEGVPDLTMIDLPGITRVPIGDQPENIYEQISGMIMEYIKPEESIILNVLSASVDFTTCESICMSRRVDSTGQRTLAVVTKCDRSPDGLLEKVTTNDVNIGLGYICVRNRINEETYEEARNQEATLFETHPLLSKIDKSMVGIPVLAHRLVQIQSVIISKCLPEIIKNINDRLNASVLDLNKLPRNLTSVPDAMVTFIQIVGSLKETLQKILIQGEFDEYENDNEMHCDARLAEMVDKLSKDLQSSVNFSENFLVEEMQVLEEANGIRLPNFLPRSVFLCLLKRKVNAISDLPVGFVNKVWDYLEIVYARVLIDRCGNYPQLLPSIKKATQYVMAKLKAMFVERVVEMIEMEKMTDYTCDPDFITSYNKLMSYHAQFSMNLSQSYMTSYSINVEGYGSIDIGHLREVPENTRNQAFDLKMRMAAYWKIVLKRMVDCLALELRYFMQKMVDKEMEMEIVNEVMVHGGGIEKMLDEPPYIAKKRERLQSSISLLKESKEIIEQVMDGIAVTSY
ncbi:putative dynamin stalk domain, GTPase effector domain, Dynamin superfamily [Helianthus annuus]|nr:putative dynamin stalk domain, GTPase effector domain, Dynamin superfamily [Helianthus annuus]KAJ0768603.1 putative dynamin stalk domain, GTPase effector domain, Dynamin superfamily [Helianthus annuus]KAJ0774349.1 putative dynamin stalk domain, GTPase effector domain, Dynamin superfamily [Helianthus annuus]